MFAIDYPAGYDFPVASVALHLMKTIVDTYTARGTDLPARRVVTIGSVAVDSPLVAVMFGGVAVGPPGNPLNAPLRGESSRTSTFNVELWRQIPTFDPSGRAPDADLITAAAKVIMQDSWLLLEAAFASDQTEVGVIASTAVHAPEGEMAGVSMTMEMMIP